MNQENIKQHIHEIVDLSASLDGHLSGKEVEFLACLLFIELQGEILEIGSFKGKSTIILAKAARAAKVSKICACDPLFLSCSTDPKDAANEDLPELFKGNLKKNNVDDIVQFFQMKSNILAESWDQPLKGLWIDGDHTYNGAMQDIQLFEKHLVPGAIVCFHDVLHAFDGPIRAFMETILLSKSFGACGMCGSIGWSQFIGDQKVSAKQWKTKLRFYRNLSRLLPYVYKKNNGLPYSIRLRRFFRSLVPHGRINPVQWIENRNNWQKS